MMVFKKYKKLKLVFGFNTIIFLILTIGLTPVAAANSLLYPALLPNDTYFNFQDYLAQIKAVEAWSITKESPAVVVAVIDSGVDIEHPDLVDNIWHNSDEVPKDGIDNDNNGYVDDTVGWDFVLNSPDPRPKFGGSYNELGINHGTVVAGVIGAIGDNNFGTAGISWSIKIMSLKVMNGEGEGQTTLVYQAVKYALLEGADIINLSMVGEAFDPLLDQIIEEAYQAGTIIVAAAGNETGGNGVDQGIDLAQSPRYPVCHDGETGHNYVLGVGSVDSSDVKSNFSNYGSSCLDLMAPGESFFGTTFFSPVMPNFNHYFSGYWSGTSLAAPQVAATAALIKGLRPDLLNKEIYDLILDNTDNIDNQNPNYQGLLGRGRLNINKVIEVAQQTLVSANLVIAPASNHLPIIQVVNHLGQKGTEFLAFAENFRGGINVTTADFDGDGQKEIIAAAGLTGGPHIRVFKINGELLAQFFAYESNFTGGVNVAAGDVDSDGQVEIITAPQSNYQPQIRIFDIQGHLKKEFLAFNQDFSSGVNLALGDFNADGFKEIVAGAGRGGAPLVKIFNGNGVLLKQFFAYPSDFTAGVKVSAYNLYHDPRTEILTSPQQDEQCQIRIFSPSGDLEQFWSVWGEGYQAGCHLTTGDLDNDNQPEIIVGKARNGPTDILIFNQDGLLKSNFTVFEKGYQGGVNFSIK